MNIFKNVENKYFVIFLILSLICTVYLVLKLITFVISTLSLKKNSVMPIVYHKIANFCALLITFYVGEDIFRLTGWHVLRTPSFGIHDRRDYDIFRIIFRSVIFDVYSESLCGVATNIGSYVNGLGRLRQFPRDPLGLIQAISASSLIILLSQLRSSSSSSSYLLSGYILSFPISDIFFCLFVQSIHWLAGLITWLRYSSCRYFYSSGLKTLYSLFK